MSQIVDFFKLPVILTADSVQQKERCLVHGNVLAIEGGTTHTHGAGAITAVAFGRMYSPTEKEPDWTFRNLQEPGDARKDSSLTRYLPHIAAKLGVEKILAPSPTDFNGLICDANDLKTEIPLGDRLIVKRGVKAEGCLLGPRDTFAISAAGCAVLIAWRSDPTTDNILQVGVAHAGLLSILNGVGTNLLEAVGRPYGDIRVAIEWPISSGVLQYEWDYEDEGPKNEALCRKIYDQFGADALPGWDDAAKRREGHVSITNMLRKQLTDAGVDSSRIYVGEAIGEHSRFYHTRDGSKKRNLIVVARA